MSDQNKTTTHEAQVLSEAIDLVETYIKPTIVDVTEPGTETKALAVLTPTGVYPVPSSIFDDNRDTPRRRTGRATALDLASLIELTNRFADSDTVIFADNNRLHPSLLTVFDYHRVGSDGLSGNLKHSARFEFPLSDEWQAWRESNGKAMEMRDFAAFLEDRIVDVLPVDGLELTEDQERFVAALGGRGRIADPAKLMEISTGLRITQVSDTAQAVNLAPGAMQIRIKSENGTPEGAMKVPSLFAIGVPVFVNGEYYQIIVRLRHRAAGNGKEVFFYEMWRTDKVFDHAFTEALAKVQEETGQPVLLGAPEK